MKNKLSNNEKTKPLIPWIAFAALVLITHFFIDNTDEVTKKYEKLLKLEEDITRNTSKGFVLKEVKTNSIFFKLGLRSGDRIYMINDQEIYSLDTMLEKIQMPKKISVVRDGKIVNLNFKN